MALYIISIALYVIFNTLYITLWINVANAVSSTEIEKLKSEITSISNKKQSIEKENEKFKAEINRLEEVINHNNINNSGGANNHMNNGNVGDNMGVFDGNSNSGGNMMTLDLMSNDMNETIPSLREKVCITYIRFMYTVLW